MDLINDLVEAMLTKLMVGEYRRLDQVVLQLIQKNNQLVGKQFNGLYLGGTPYSTLGLPWGTPWPAIHSELLVKGAELQHLEDVIKEDHNRLRQILNLLYEPCKTLADVGRTSPKCLTPFLGGLAEWITGNAEDVGFTLRDNPRHWQQFQALLPKIEMLAVTSMIY